MNSWYFTGSSSSWRFISVANGPGQIVFTVTPVPAHSSASTRDRFMTPAFAEAYGARPGSAMTDRIEPRLIDASPAALDHLRADGREQRNGPLRLVSMHRVPVRFRQLIDLTADVGAGVVDQDVDLAEVGFDVAGQPFDVGGDGDVRREAAAGAPGLTRRSPSPSPGTMPANARRAPHPRRPAPAPSPWSCPVPAPHP